MIYKQFYSELGKLLYAVADIDGAISPAEKKALREIVAMELAPAEVHTDEFGTDVAFYSEMEFDYLEDTMSEPEPAFESFIEFVKDHHTAFDDKLKKVCVRVAKELAAAYRGTKKKEKLLIKKLEQTLSNI
jgi:hypothetical protein